MGIGPYEGEEAGASPRPTWGTMWERACHPERNEMESRDPFFKTESGLPRQSADYDSLRAGLRPVARLYAPAGAVARNDGGGWGDDATEWLLRGAKVAVGS